MEMEFLLILITVSIITVVINAVIMLHVGVVHFFLLLFPDPQGLGPAAEKRNTVP